MSDKVLIVDDDPAICKLMEKVLRSNELETQTVGSGKDALALLITNRSPFDLILLDVMLGDMEGFEVIRELREHAIFTPVIIVSGRSEDFDSIYGLSIGADDYVTKPFRPVVLGAKVKALIRRSRQLQQPHAQSTDSVESISLHAFRYNASTMRFYKNDEELVLSSKEGTLLLLFLRNPRTVFSREQIYEYVWGNAIVVDDNAIMVYINRLRNKIETDPKNPQYIVTVRGLGYRFDP